MPTFDVSINTPTIMKFIVEANNMEDAIKMALKGNGKFYLSYVLDKEFYDANEVEEE